MWAGLETYKETVHTKGFACPGNKILFTLHKYKKMKHAVQQFVRKISSNLLWHTLYVNVTYYSSSKKPSHHSTSSFIETCVIFSPGFPLDRNFYEQWAFTCFGTNTWWWLVVSNLQNSHRAMLFHSSNNIVGQLSE